jgi:hypothetical protein
MGGSPESLGKKLDKDRFLRRSCFFDGDRSRWRNPGRRQARGEE